LKKATGKTWVELVKEAFVLEPSIATT